MSETQPIIEDEAEKKSRFYKPAVAMLANAIRLSASPDLIKTLEDNLERSGELKDFLPSTLNELKKEARNATKNAIQVLGRFLKEGKYPEWKAGENTDLPNNAIASVTQRNPYSEQAIKDIHKILGIRPEQIIEDIRPDHRWEGHFMSSTMIPTPLGFSIEQTRGQQSEGMLRSMSTITIKVPSSIKPTSQT